jgi:hypothetical protein
MTDRTPHDDRDLRHLLEDAVADVEPTPALDSIRERTRAKDTHMSDARPWIFGFVGAAAATAAVVVGVAVLGDEQASPTDPASSPTAEADPSESVEPAPSETADGGDGTEPDGGATAELTVPVYYVGDTPAGVRLFREFHRVSAPDGAVAAALTEAVDSAPLDADYRTPWTDLGVTVQAAEESGGGLRVDLGGASLAERPAGMDAEEAELAVEQLVWTATAAAQSDTDVRFSLDGSAADRLLGVNVGGGASRADAMETLAPVWVTSPQDGEAVGSTFNVEGQGAFFEANVSWQLLDGSGAVVEDGFATAQECCTLSPYSFQVKGVAPGTYTLRVYSADVSGGEGPGEPEDTKRLTVR